MTEEERKAIERFKAMKFKAMKFARKSTTPADGNAKAADSGGYTKGRLVALDTAGRTTTLTLGYVYPSVASASLRSALQGINALTADTYMSAIKIVETDITYAH